jgi:hypothetical protein
MSLSDPAITLLNAEYSALLTPQARNRFLTIYSGMPSDTVERIDLSGTPWPGTLERELREAEALGIEFSRYMSGLADMMEQDAVRLEQSAASIAAALDRGDVPAPSSDFDDMRDRMLQVAKSTGENFEHIAALHGAVLAYHQVLFGLAHRAALLRKQRPT